MKRVLAVAAVAALALLPAAPASASGPGGQCDGTVDTLCRTRPCAPDELDCGMVPPCLVWVAGTCRL